MLEESKVTDVVESLKRLRKESDERVRLVRESEAQVRFELDKMRARANADEAHAKAAEAKVVASGKELSEMALDAVHLVWSYNWFVDLSFLQEPTLETHFETRLAVVHSEGRALDANPIVVIEADVPSDAPEILKAKELFVYIYFFLFSL